MDKDIVIAGITYVIAPVVACAATYFFTKKGDESKGNIEQTSCCKQQKLEHHSFFVDLQCMKESVKTSFELQNKGKEAIGENIIENKLESWENELKATAQKIDKLLDSEGDTDNNHLYNIHMEAFNAAVARYNNYFYNSYYTQEEQDVLKYAIGKFNAYHQPKVELMKGTIRSFCYSDYIPNARIKSACIFNMYSAALGETLLDMEAAFKDMNGYLTAKTFKGVVI